MVGKKNKQPAEEAPDAKVKKQKKPRRTAEDYSQDKDEPLYPVRKGKMMKFGRVLLWSMLAFLCLRGIIVSIRPDATAEVKQLISEFKEDYASNQQQTSEVMAFAEAFATEYLTYSGSQATTEYTERLSRYAADSVVSAVSRIPSGTSAQVVHALAYKQEAYSDTQVDVWVQLEVTYTKTTTAADGLTESTTTTSENTILKVPVSINGSYYVVEDYPAFVNDDVKDSGYKSKSYTGYQTDSDTNKAIKSALTNFFAAYYESEQSVINYYLTADANTDDFVGLNGRVQFSGISSLLTYYKSQEDTQNFIAVVTVKVTDKNGVELLQSFNLELEFKDKQYYIDTMNVRSSNLDF